MARSKNALTRYYVGEYTGLASDATLPLGHRITDVSDETDETVEESAFYDGDGTPESDVTSIKKAYAFEGMYEPADAAMKFIADLELKVGDDRKIAFKQVRPDGTTLTGRATVTEIKTTGGAAADFQPFTCNIAWDVIPTVTNTPN